MHAKKPSLLNFDKFGLSADQCAALGDAKLKLHVSLRHVNERSLFKFAPDERIDRIKRHYETLFARVKRKWTGGPINVSWIRRQPRGFDASIAAKHLLPLSRMPEISFISLIEAPGRKRVSAKPKERWFSVHARFAIQVEGQMSGLQSYEDRTLIVKAHSFDDAKRKLQPQFKQYGTPYLNPAGFMVRWTFERVLDVFEIGGEEIDPLGMEVHSVLSKRRIKPEFAWKPKSVTQGNGK